MKKKILLVEDDKFLIRTYGFKLEDSGYEILRLEDGIKVFSLAKEKSPDLIILDIIMPNKNGFDALRELKADKDTKNIPVIIVSNLSQQKDIDEGMALGLRNLLSSPISVFRRLRILLISDWPKTGKVR